MAATKKNSSVKQYKISIEGNENFCGVDAGGVQFAYGYAIIAEGRMVDWFKEHEGYIVEEVKDSEGD